MVYTELPKSFFNENSMIRKHPKPDRNLQNQNARAMRQAFIFRKETFGRKRAHRVPSTHAREVAAQAE